MTLDEILKQLQQGTINLEEAQQKIVPYTTATNTAAPKTTVSASEAIRIDLDRARRCGFPEVIYAEGKSEEQITDSVHALLQAGQPCLATRVSPQQAESLRKTFSNELSTDDNDATTFRWNKTARTVSISASSQEPEKPYGRVVVVTAGTTDLPVAGEAMETLRWMNIACELISDIGVAGPQRLLQNVERLENCDAIVVVAGMEGALASVVAGWVKCPVIAVPTSVGYGANLGGIAALLSMLNSCAANVAVVNIDSGFKAAHIAGVISQSRRDFCAHEEPPH